MQPVIVDARKEFQERVNDPDMDLADVGDRRM
jgi:hypothetical protein